MLTVKQIERMWQLKAYERLIDDLCMGRAEAVGGIRQLLSGPQAAAALAIIRLGELNQSHQPFIARMVRFLIASQQSDGGFADAACTALVVRALATDAGASAVLDAGLIFLDQLQKETGEWPREPVRRMPPDPAVTAFVLLQLVESRLPRAKTLINRTLDRLGEKDPATISTDRQLLPLRRRVAIRQPELAGNWS